MHWLDKIIFEAQRFFSHSRTFFCSKVKLHSFLSWYGSLSRLALLDVHRKTEEWYLFIRAPATRMAACYTALFSIITWSISVTSLCTTKSTNCATDQQCKLPSYGGQLLCHPAGSLLSTPAPRRGDSRHRMMPSHSITGKFRGQNCIEALWWYLVFNAARQPKLCSNFKMQYRGSSSHARFMVNAADHQSFRFDVCLPLVSHPFLRENACFI